jgi:hypothetical protein
VPGPAAVTTWRVRCTIDDATLAEFDGPDAREQAERWLRKTLGDDPDETFTSEFYVEEVTE